MPGADFNLILRDGYLLEDSLFSSCAGPSSASPGASLSLALSLRDSRRYWLQRSGAYPPPIFGFRRRQRVPATPRQDSVGRGRGTRGRGALSAVLGRGSIWPLPPARPSLPAPKHLAVGGGEPYLGLGRGKNRGVGTVRGSPKSRCPPPSPSASLRRGAGRTCGSGTSGSRGERRRWDNWAEQQRRPLPPSLPTALPRPSTAHGSAGSWEPAGTMRAGAPNGEAACLALHHGR